MMRVLLFDRAVDMTRPLTFVLDLRPGLGLFSVEYPGDRRIVDDEEQIGSSLPLAGGSARWAALLALLLFVTVAFLVKRTR
jgi:hypothetical protein